jgi:hypothetical protein
MYTLVRAYGIEKLPNSLWKDLDVSLLKLSEIFIQYRDIYIELSSPFITDPIYVHLKDLESTYSGSQRTLSELFTYQPSLSLPTVAKIPSYVQKPAMYMDAFRAGYKLELTAPGHLPSSHFSEILKTEIAIRRDATSNKDLHDYCLFSVNGFLHPTDYDDKYLYVMEGGKSLRRSRRNTCGINSFERIGKIHKQRITVADFTPVDADTLLSRKVFIQAPPEFRDMTLMLSIGGYLITPEDNIFSKIADDLWILNTEQLDLLGKYFESRQYLDFESLNLTKFGKDKNKISLLEFQSNLVISKYLTLPQSFFIACEVPELTFRKQYVRHSPIANQYIAYSNPISPLFLGRGRQADYWKQQDESYWSITVENGYRPNLTKDTVDDISQLVDAGTNTPFNIFENSRAFILDIISQQETP